MADMGALSAFGPDEEAPTVDTALTRASFPNYNRGPMTAEQPAGTGALSLKYIQDRIDRGDEDVKRYTTEQDKAYTDLDVEQKRKIDQIQQIMQSVSNQQPDRTRLLAAISAGFLKPTRTGGFAESLGNVGEATQNPLADMDRQRQASRDRAQQLGLAGLDLAAEMAKGRAALAGTRAERGYKMTDSGLKLLELQQKLAESAEQKRLDRESREGIASDNQSLRDAIVQSQIEGRKTAAQIAADARRDAAQAKVDADRDKKDIAPPPIQAVAKYQAHETAKLANDQITNEVDGWIRGLEEGTLKLGLKDNAINYMKTETGLGGDDESVAYSTFKTGLEDMRNKMLSLQTGVQTEGDARRIMNGIVARINDPKYVKEQLKLLRTKLQQSGSLYDKQLDDLARQYKNIRPKVAAPSDDAAGTDEPEVIDFNDLPPKR